MAGRTCWLRRDEQGVPIAIGTNVLHAKPVTARLALLPEPVLRAAVEGDQAGATGLLKGCIVHIAQHQHLTGIDVLDDGGDQPAMLAPVDRLRAGTSQRRTSIPPTAIYSFSSGLATRPTLKQLGASP